MKKIVYFISVFITAIFFTGCDEGKEPEQDGPFYKSYCVLRLELMDENGEHLVNRVSGMNYADFGKGVDYDVRSDGEVLDCWVGPPYLGKPELNTYLDFVSIFKDVHEVSTINYSVTCPLIFGSTDNHVIASTWEYKEDYKMGKCTSMTFDGVEYEVTYDTETGVNHATVLVKDKE